MTASPAELRLMLFDGAIRFAEQARAALERKDYESCYTGSTRCQAILMELINALKPDHDPELCERLAALYTFMYMQMVKATTERSVGIVDDVLRLLRYERETWVMLMQRLAEESNIVLEPKAVAGTTVSVRG
jgi:flagellar protein FliS